MLQRTSGAATIPPMGAPLITLAFKDDCEKQECACLAGAKTFLASLTLSVCTNNSKTIKESFKVATTTTQKFNFGIN